MLHRNSYNKCVKEHADGLYRFMLKSTRNVELAKDLVQEAYTRLWEKRKDIDDRKAKSYVFTIGYRLMVDWSRTNKRNPRLEVKHVKSHSYTDEYSGIQEVLHEALNTLPDIQKQVVLLRDYEGYSYSEISEITDLSESQVKVYIFRARKALKEKLVSVHEII